MARQIFTDRQDTYQVRYNTTKLQGSKHACHIEKEKTATAHTHIHIHDAVLPSDESRTTYHKQLPWCTDLENTVLSNTCLREGYQLGIRTPCTLNPINWKFRNPINLVTTVYFYNQIFSL